MATVKPFINKEKRREDGQVLNPSSTNTRGGQKAMLKPFINKHNRRAEGYAKALHQQTQQEGRRLC